MRYLRWAMFKAFRKNLLALLLIAFPLAADPIEPQHPVYALLRRGEAVSLVPLGFTQIRPRDRSEVVATLKDMVAKMGTQNPGALGDALPEAKRHLHALDWDLRRNQSRLVYSNTASVASDASVDSLASTPASDTPMRGGLQADFLGSTHYLDSLPRPQAYSTGIFAVQLAGSFGERLSLVSQAYLGMERSVVDRFRENYDPSQGLPYNTDREGKRGEARGVSTFDGFRAVIGYGQGPFRIEAGEDWNAWGPGLFSQTALGTTPWFWVQDSLPASDSVGYKGTVWPGGFRRGFREPGEASPLPQLRLRFGAGAFEYVKVVAQRTALHIDSSAWLVIHRLTWRPTPNLSLGGTEMVTVGGRTPDLGYWLPLVPLKYAEHQYGDRDNIALGMDVTYRLPWAMLAHAEILLDDFSGPPLDFWGNKYALTTGLHAAALPGKVEAMAEYSQVSPWFFTHHRPGTQMQSYGALLGSALPADSHRLLIRLIHHWRSYADFRLEGYAMQRSVGSRQAQVFSVHADSVDGTQRRFLDGPVETRQSLGLGSHIRYAPLAEVRLWVGGMRVEAWKGEKGRDLMTPWFHGTLHVTY